MAYGRFGASKVSDVKPVNPVQNFNSSTVEYIDPSKHGAISQLINNHYLNEVRKDTKKVLMGRKLEAFLKKTFSVNEFKQLPVAAQNLIRLNRGLSAAEIIRFAEYWDNSHEIIFKEYSCENSKFRAMFEEFGKLYDVQMQAGVNNYVSVSKDFDVRKKIEQVFSKAVEKLLFLKKPSSPQRVRTRKTRKYTKIENIDDNRSGESL